MNISELIALIPETPVISIAGAGGKTTLMFRLAKILAGTCVTTTTTKVGSDQILAADSKISLDEFEKAESLEKIIWVSPSLYGENGKISGCGTEEFDRLAEICKKRSYTLINEADGAARKHIKAPADHEPVIPLISNVCIYVAGLDTLNKPNTKEYVHRPEIFSKITGLKEGETIKAEHILRLLDSSNGGHKNFPKEAMKVLYLTHANSADRKDAADYIQKYLSNYDAICVNE